MLKLDSPKELIFSSTTLALISQLFFDISVPYFILLLLVLIDTLTGTAIAIIFKQFSKKSFRKFVEKIFTYTACIFTVRLLEWGIVNLYSTTLASQIVLSFLIILETISILENLAILGVPLPVNLIKYVWAKVKLPAFIQYNLNTSYEKDIQEIDALIKYRIPTFNNAYIRTQLVILLETYKKTMFEIHYSFQDNVHEDQELIYCKMKVILDHLKEDRDLRWKEEGIPQQFIDLYYKWNKDKLDAWMEKIKVISYQNISLNTKKQLFIDSLKVLIYQIIIDTHKGLATDL